MPADHVADKDQPLDAHVHTGAALGHAACAQLGPKPGRSRSLCHKRTEHDNDADSKY